MLRRSSPGLFGQLEDGETEPLLHHNSRQQTQSTSGSLFHAASINSTATPIADQWGDGRDVVGEGQDGVGAAQELVVYRRRWWILLVFSMMAFAQNLIWNTWSPLDKSVALAFNWTTADVALQTNWGCITFVVFAPIFSWLMDVKGLRVSCVLTGFLLVLGSGLRCISSDPKTATWLIHCGQFLNGMAGPVITAGPPLLSSVWFPAAQRTIATSLALLAAGFGVAASYIIGPLAVPMPETHHHMNSTEWNDTSTEDYRDPVKATVLLILRLMYIECAFTVAVFVALLIYFPAKPPSAPSVSANTTRLGYKAGFRALIRNRDFWKVALCFGVTMGIADQWSSILDVDVTDLVESEMELGWVGFASSVACGIGGFVLSWFSDRYMKHVKLILLCIFSMSLCVCLVFGLICSKVIPFNKSAMYSLYIVTVIGIEGSSPLFYELGCETAYPTSEGLTNGVLTWLDNCVGLVFLLVLMIPGIGLRWMNWVMTGGIAISIPLLLFYRENYRRLDVDVTVATPDGSDETADDEKGKDADVSEGGGGGHRVSSSGDTMRPLEEEEEGGRCVPSLTPQINVNSCGDAI